MSEEEKPFTVTDRRHFTPEGEARAETPHPAAAGAESPAAPAAEMRGRQDHRPEAAGVPLLDFAGLLVFLGAQAQLLMAGDAAGEAGGSPDLEGARSFISLLETLKEKTEGRRTPEEDQVLQALLYQLRLEYVARSRTGGA